MAVAVVEQAKEWVDVEQPVKPPPISAESLEAEVASARRRKTIKIALGVGTGIVVALFVALTIALAVTYTRDKDNGNDSQDTTTPTAAPKTPTADSSSSSTTETTGPTATTTKVRSPFYQDATTVVTTSLTAAQNQELNVGSWTATTAAAGSASKDVSTADRDTYVAKGQALVTWFKVDGKSSTASTIVVTAGQMVTVPAGLEVVWNFITDTVLNSKLYQ